MNARGQEARSTPISGVLAKFLITLTLLIAAYFLIAIALTQAMHRKTLRDSIRRFNRRWLNPTVLHFAGNQSRIYAAVEHQGRRTGRVYSTPVIARPFGDGFAMPLPYGADTDWCRNVQAAGMCTLYWDGCAYVMEKPELVPPARVLAAFPLVQRIIFAAGGIKQYLVLHTQRIISPERGAPAGEIAEKPRHLVPSD